MIDPTYTHGMWGREFTPTSVGLPKHTIELHLELPQRGRENDVDVAVVAPTSDVKWA